MAEAAFSSWFRSTLITSRSQFPLHLAATLDADAMISALQDAGANPMQKQKNWENAKMILTRFHNRHWDTIQAD
jgi:hypothetical protein